MRLRSISCLAAIAVKPFGFRLTKTQLAVRRSGPRLAYPAISIYPYNAIFIGKPSYLPDILSISAPFPRYSTAYIFLYVYIHIHT